MPPSSITSPSSRTLSDSARARRLSLALAAVAIAVAVAVVLLPTDRRAAGRIDATSAPAQPTVFHEPIVVQGHAVGRLQAAGQAEVGLRSHFFNDPQVIKGARGAPLP